MLLEETVQILPAYRYELSGELASILDFWMQNTIDHRQGGFVASLDNNNISDAQAAKGVVLNSRILWTFSAAYRLLKKQDYLDIASRAYQYIIDHFIDRRYGGVYWSVTSDGSPLDTRKQIYGLAFCIYGLSEYSHASGERIPLHLAKDLFEKIEQYSFDKARGGYIEAFTQGWNCIDDLRLSEKDANEKKTMNTHLHIIEAYANLSSVCPDQRIRNKIAHLLDIFDKYIIDQETSHLKLFMDVDWNTRSSLVSYGHDIEAAWLLLSCAESLHDKHYIDRFNELSIRITDAAARGLDKDGGLWYEYEPATNQLIREKHWWSQAEAMIGFFNAYQLTGDEKYLHHSVSSWEFVKNHLKDQWNGEWYWGVYDDYSTIRKEKAGFWKCPYHNARACIELIRRIEGKNI